MKSTFGKTLYCWTPIAALAFGLLLLLGTARAVEVDFGELTLDPESQWDGVDTTFDNGSGDYHTSVLSGATFYNYHEWARWGAWEYHSWEGWAYSNRTDTDSTGLAGQYTAMAVPAGGQGDANYGVAYCGFYNLPTPTVAFDEPYSLESAYFTNNAYTYHSMLTGDSMAKKFGGEDGTDEDWFLLTIIGKDASDSVTGTVEFYLADYRYDDDYIVNDWTLVDLTSLGNNVSSLEFALSSSDVGEWGMNTPAYFAMDSLTVVPEPSTFALIVVGGLMALVWRRWRRE